MQWVEKVGKHMGIGTQAIYSFNINIELANNSCPTMRCMQELFT